MSKVKVTHNSDEDESILEVDGEEIYRAFGGFDSDPVRKLAEALGDEYEEVVL